MALSDFMFTLGLSGITRRIHSNTKSIKLLREVFLHSIAADKLKIIIALSVFLESSLRYVSMNINEVWKVARRKLHTG